ncbi:hypothetical protein [Lacinutrix sp. MEBiC02595]
MKNILNDKKSLHFKKRLNQRKIEKPLIRLCLIKGVVKLMGGNKVEHTLSLEGIVKAIEQGYISVGDCIGITKLTVVAKENRLITVYARFGDTGITH